MAVTALARRLQRRVDVARVRGVAGRVLRVRVARLAQPAPVVAGARQLRVALPDDLQLRRRLDRVVLLRRDDGEEVVDLDELRARDVLDRRLVDALPGSGSATCSRPAPRGRTIRACSIPGTRMLWT